MADPEYTTVNHTYMTEPRINLIKAELESLLQLIELEKDGKVVKVDGFRLKKPADWVIRIPNSAFLNIGSLSSVCRIACVFCSELGNKELPWSEKRSFLSVEEVRTRLKYYSELGKGIFPIWAPSFEPLENPNIIEILRMIRKRSPEEYLGIVTNGKLLTEPMIKELVKLIPLTILISLNSADPEWRRRLMKDSNPKVAINAVKLLEQYRIPFEGGIVPWPTLPLEDVGKTIRYLSEHNAYRIIINLPTWTRGMSETPLFDSDEVWSRIVAYVDQLRAELPTPIVYGPNLYAEKNVIPRIIGTVKNSPGSQSGIKFGDIIEEVNGIPMLSQFEARYYLSKSAGKEVTLKIQRGKETLLANVPPTTEYEYPYTEIVEREIGIKGIVIPEGFHIVDLRKLEKIITNSNSKRVLFLSAKILKPFFEEQLQRFYNLGDLELFIEVPKHRFWGGNLIDGSLYMVDDFIAHIHEFIGKRGFPPDLVVIPSTPFAGGGWNRDYLGKTYSEIERKTGVPVEILPTQQITF
jgi:hypothetical protein